MARKQPKTIDLDSLANAPGVESLTVDGRPYMPRRRIGPVGTLAPDPRAAGRWTLTIEGWHPTPLNKLLTSHWAKAGRMKKADAATIEHELKSVPVATMPRRVSLRIILEPRQRACDPDAYWKSLLDAMVAAGKLVDDNRQWCETTPVEFERGKAKATILTIEDIAA